MNCWCNKEHKNIKPIDVLVVSIGGVNTTHLLNKLEECEIITNKKNDTDHIKHVNYNYNKELINAYNPKKVIYIYNDCINSLYSLFRRNFHWAQIKKLTNNKNILPDDIKTVEDYLNYCKNIDLFHILLHFNSWFTQKKYPIMFVNSSKMYNEKNQKIIRNFLNVKNLQLGEYKERNSNWLNENDETKKKLIKIYGKFNKYLMNLKPIIIKNY